MAYKKVKGGDESKIRRRVFHQYISMKAGFILPAGIHLNRDVDWHKKISSCPLGHHTLNSIYGEVNGQEIV